MALLIGIRINVKGIALTEEAFRTEYLIPVCGEEASFKVLQNIRYQLFCVNASELAKEMILKYDETSKPYIEYNDYGVSIKLRYQYFDNICEVDVLKCESEDPQPP